MVTAGDNAYERGRVIGEMLTEIKLFRAEQNQKHIDNMAVMAKLDDRVSDIEDKVNTLWAWKGNIVFLGIAVSVGAGFVVHFAADLINIIPHI